MIEICDSGKRHHARYHRWYLLHVLPILGLFVAGFSLAVSATTAWLTLWRRGSVRMAQPPTVYFGPDGGEQRPKIFVRAFLYSTSRRGHIVEGMFARLRRGDSSQTFSVWVCGGARGDLSRGAGLAVGPEGVALHHHFLLPRDGSTYQFLPGSYVVELFAVVVGHTRAIKLHAIELNVTDAHSARLRNEQNTGLYFDWSPEALRFHGHIDVAKIPDSPPLFLIAQPQQDSKAKNEDPPALEADDRHEPAGER